MDDYPCASPRTQPKPPQRAASASTGSIRSLRLGKVVVGGGSAAIALVIVSYVVSYFAMGGVFTLRPAGHRIRVYQSRWLAHIYLPVAKAESLATTVPVRTGYFVGEIPCILE